MSDNDKIFVQIASYRDPQLLPTIRDCIEKADKPDNLVFAIAWQRAVEDEWDTLAEFEDDPRVNVIVINHNESKGACWARYQTQEFYNGEQYVLQIDSHHRFAKGWDTECKRMISDLQMIGHAKPLLTAYLPSYDPDDDPKARAQDVWQMNFDRFTPEGVVFMYPSVMENWKKMKFPVPTRFFSAHFVFTLGEWNTEVRYDPELYFHGEEITLAVRSYTHGYDLFTPHKIVCWHEYTRKNRTKHWDDHKDWTAVNEKSIRRVKSLLLIDDYPAADLGKYGFGTERTLEQYERYAGIRFRDRAVQQYTLDNKSAPNPKYFDRVDYDKSFIHLFKHCVNIYKGSFKEGDLEKFSTWAVIFENEHGVPIYRQDAERAEIDQMIQTSTDPNWFHLWRTIPDCAKVPHRAVVVPYTEYEFGHKFIEYMTKFN